MYRMTELRGLPKNSSDNLSPSAVVDFLPSHDSADLFGAAWLYTMSNGFPSALRRRRDITRPAVVGAAAPPHTELLRAFGTWGSAYQYRTVPRKCEFYISASFPDVT